MEQMNMPRHYLNDSTRAPLQAVRLPSVDSVLLTNFTDKWCDMGKLHGYFSNKAESGAASARSVEIKGRDRAVVSFHETQSKFCAWSYECHTTDPCTNCT